MAATIDLAAERLAMLNDARDQRQRAVMHYQLNIDNFSAAIALIQAEHADDADLLTYAGELRLLLEQTIQQQARERVLLRVIEAQLETADVG